jgi:hypothetical protein
VTLPREPDPQPELTTSPVRGGPSPWLVAVIAVAVLGTVIYIGVSGRDSTTTPLSTQRPVVAVAPQPTPTSSSTPIQNAAPAPQVAAAYPGIAVSSNPSTPAPSEYLAAKLDVGSFSALAELTTAENGHYHAAYSVPLPVPVPTGDLSLVDVINQQPSLANFGTWQVPLDVFHGGVNQDSVIGAFGETVLVQRIRPPDPTAAMGTPDIERNGYTIQVAAERQDNAEQIAVDVVVGPGPLVPNEHYIVKAQAGSRSFVGHIQDQLPGHIRGEILFPGAFRPNSVQLVVVAVSDAKHGLHKYPVVNSPVALPALSDFPDGTLSTEVSAPPVDVEPGFVFGFPLIVDAGYQLHLVSTFNGGNRVIFYDLQVNTVFPPRPAAIGPQ